MYVHTYIRTYVLTNKQTLKITTIHACTDTHARMPTTIHTLILLSLYFQLLSGGYFCKVSQLSPTPYVNITAIPLASGKLRLLGMYTFVVM